MKYLVLIQARCGSTRFPNKVMADLSGKPDIQWVIERVQRSQKIDEVMVITSIDKNNIPLIHKCSELGVRVFVGSEEDVLDRYYQAARLIKPEYVIRVTADCPMFDWRYLDMAIQELDEETDYLTELSETFPDGLDIEIMKYDALCTAWKEAQLKSEREHVTLYIRNHPEKFISKNLVCPIRNISHMRWTLDEDRDYQMISKVYEYFISQGKSDFVTEDILDYLKEHPEIGEINADIVRNEGLQKSLKNDYRVDMQA